MLANPWPKNSWLLFSRSPLRRARVWDAATASISPRAATAMAPTTRLRTSPKLGNWPVEIQVGGGSERGIRPTTSTPKASSPSNRTASAAPAMQISAAGKRGPILDSATSATSVTRPNVRLAGFTSPARAMMVATVRYSSGIAGRSMPSRWRIWPSEIRTAAPAVKPSSTDREASVTSAPNRSMARTILNSPAITARALAASRYSGLPGAATASNTGSTSKELALTGPVARNREQPHRAPTIAPMAAV